MNLTIKLIIVPESILRIFHLRYQSTFQVRGQAIIENSSVIENIIKKNINTLLLMIPPGRPAQA